MSKSKKVPYHKKPDNMSIETWQVELRRQFAVDQNFDVENIGGHPVFPDFKVFNPVTGKTYKVAIRANEFGMNFCSCPDFKINGLGTCKHIEFVLYKLKNNVNNLNYFEGELLLPYSSLSLRYEKERKLYLRIGTDRFTDFMNSLEKLTAKDMGYYTPFASNSNGDDMGDLSKAFQREPDVSNGINGEYTDTSFDTSVTKTVNLSGLQQGIIPDNKEKTLSKKVTSGIQLLFSKLKKIFS